MMMRITIAFCATGLALTGATAAPVTAELAKTCNALVEKKYPPVQPGNPAAGLRNGSSADARAAFRKCVDNNGKVDDAQPAK